MKSQPLTIVGGGLAGLTLGIALRRQDLPVTVIEAGHYPRHRVCGEFLSGRGQDILSELDLLAHCQGAGARPAETVRFAAPQFLGPERSLPRPALCLSRHAMDALLAAEFVRSGGELRTGERVPEAGPQAGTIRATGRRAATGGTAASWRWFGVKGHARQVVLEADLELHVVPGAYVGLCRLADGLVNVCGLFRRRVGESEALPRSPADWLRGPPDSQWRERLAHAEFDRASLCSVGGLDLSRPGAADPGELRLGDAFSMIPPVTGNGMSLAIESAALAAVPIAAYARGETSWEASRNATARHLDRAFSSRLRTAGWLQRMLFLPLAPALLLRMTARSDRLWRGLFAATRG